MPRPLKKDTSAVRIQARRSHYREHSVPVFETSSFLFESASEAERIFKDENLGYSYSRFANPNTDELVKKLCALENADDGVVTASGMAAVFISLFTILRPGDHVLAGRQIFGSTHILFTQVLSKFGISHTYADINKKEEWEENILPNTRIIFAETPSNPGLDIIDLKWLVKLARKYDLYLIIDNCFATPVGQNPLDLGADIVVHSTTKLIDGQGRTIGGAIVGNGEIMQEIRMFTKVTGPVMSPHTAWLLSKSIETLSVRIERHSANALKLAGMLQDNKEVIWVKYPFLPTHPQYKIARKQMKTGGNMVTFELKGGIKRAHRFIDALALVSISSNLGDTRTIITHPTTTTHSKLSADERKLSGITDGMLRVSVGLENIDDLITDFEQAIGKSGT
jgi:O-succinylhomoserine sulfhydrylase